MIEEKILSIHGNSIYVKHWFPQTLMHYAPVILIHDSLGCVDLWRKFPAELAVALHRPVIAYDRAGYGCSSELDALPFGNFILDEANLIIPALRSALGITDYFLFGHSVGGSIALHGAGLDKEHCLGVICESAQAFLEQKTIDAIELAKQEFADPSQFARLVRWHGKKAQWVLDAWTDVWLEPSKSDWKLSDSLPSIHCPALILHGDRDEFGSNAFPESIAKWAGAQSEIVMFANCGHVPHREYPSLVLESVTTFINRIDG